MIDISYSISADTLSIAEGNSGSRALTFTVSRSGAIQDTSSIDYTISGSASSGSDFNNIGGNSGAAGLSGTISFSAGEEEKTITLHMVGDTTFERNESITIGLSNATASNGTATISTADATSTIVNDDAAPPASDLTGVVFTAGPDLAISNEGWRLESVIQALEGDDIIIGEGISLGAGSAGFGRSGTLDTGAGDDSITATITSDSTFALSINILSKLIAGSGNDFISGLSKGFSGYGLSSSGLIDTGEGNDSITGASNGSKDVFTGGAAISNTGTIETGIGNDSITTFGIWSYGFLSFGMTKTGSGNDSIASSVTGYYSAIRNADSSQSLGVIDTGAGSDTITASSNGTAIDNDGSIITGDGNDSITGIGTESREVLNKGYSYGYGIISYNGTIDTGNGNDTITGSGWGLGGYGIFCSNRIDTGSGNDVVDALVGGFAGRGLINLGDGDDTLKGFGFVTQWGTGLFDAGLGSDRLLIGEAGTYTISAQADQSGFYSLRKDSNLMLIKSFEFLGNANDGTQFSFAPGTSFTIDPATTKIVFSSIHTVSNVSLGFTGLGYAIKVGSTNPIQISNAGTNASPTSPGGGWSAIAAAANGTGFDLYLKNTNGSYEIWNLNGVGIQSGSKAITATEFYAAEASLSNDLNGDSYVGNPFAAIKTVGSVVLGSNANGYALKVGSADPIQITYADTNASPTSPGGGWSAIATAANETGFDLYLKNTSGSYGLWRLDGAGVLTGNKPLTVSEFYAAEISLSNDLNGDGQTGFSFSPAKTIGTVQFGSSQHGYALKNGSNPLLSITNAGAVATEAGGWSALAATSSGNGYDLYWKHSNGTYAKWILNSSAALVSGALLSTADFLQAETSLGTDLDADGKTGFSFSPAKSIAAVQFGTTQLGYALKHGSNPLLSITNAGAVATEAGGWSALAAASSGNGYDLYWKHSYGTYAQWILNSSAALTSGFVISTADFLQAESNLATDLDGDGKTGFSFSPAKTIGTLQFGSSQLGYALKHGSNPLLSITNAGAVATEAGGWSALAAASSGNGYDLYWKHSNGTYAKWILNSSAGLTSGFVISTADFLQAETNLATDLDADGKTGFSFSPAKTIAAVQFGSTQLGYALINGSNPLLSITNAGAVATEAGGWSALAAAAAGDGYELYWKHSNGTYAKWILNSSAALTRGFVISTADFLQAETSLATDLDGDGKTGFSFSPAKTIGTVQFGSSQLGYALKNGNNPLLAITNADDVATEAGGWSGLAAAAAGNGYELYWKHSNGTYAKWILNSSAALTRGFVISTADFLQAETNLSTDLDADGSIGVTVTPSPSSTSTIYSGSFATPNEIDSYSVDVAPGTIISASITTPSQQSLYPLINLFDTSSSLLKGSLTYNKDFADLGMFDLITGKAMLKISTQTGFLGDYELKLSFTNRDAAKDEVVSLTNAQRLQAGLNPLTRNQLLESAAQTHVADMDASNRYLAHTGSNGSDPVTRIAATGYKGGWVDLGNGQLRTISSENAAAGQKTPAEVVNAWMNSPGHRAAILDPYTKEIGIGFEFDNEVGNITDQSYKIGTTYWVQNFGYPWQTGMQVWF
jgi:uncharacterized protein YkwD/deoxyadenosine/deoxycytidine kinase